MIQFKNLCKELPYLIFKEKYDNSIALNQKNIEAISISSYSIENNEVDSRLVNLKYIDYNKFIFFSNYHSPKSIDFISHNQISALLYWPSTNVQIRMKAIIDKTPTEFNQEHFDKRSLDKNALAISSKQSKPIASYDEVIKRYNKVKEENNLKDCPKYWGGYYFTPYYFEFWEGNSSRLNKRNIYKKDGRDWKHLLLQP